ncbi:MAG: hypothetical protein M1840_007954 [Geoglossum simile]|nr:MAG: hypothetical protein M1840_007954 [Geoglossum simile]
MHIEHIDLTFNDSPDLEPKQQVSRKSPKPQEPLPMKYTLSIDVFVDNIRVEAQKTSCLQDKSKKDMQLSWAITCQLKALSVELEMGALKPYEDESKDDTKDDDENAEKTHSSKKFSSFEVF